MLPKAKETERLNGVDSELKSVKMGKDEADGAVLELRRNVEVNVNSDKSMLKIVNDISSSSLHQRMLTMMKRSFVIQLSFCPAVLVHFASRAYSVISSSGSNFEPQAIFLAT